MKYDTSIFFNRKAIETKEAIVNEKKYNSRFHGNFRTNRLRNYEEPFDAVKKVNLCTANLTPTNLIQK